MNRSGKLYKALGYDRMPMFGGKGQWPSIGEWHSVEPPLKPRTRGLHVVDREHFLAWCCAPTIYEVEVSGALVPAGDGKVCAERARLVRQLDWNSDKIDVLYTKLRDEGIPRLFNPDTIERVRKQYGRGPLIMVSPVEPRWSEANNLALEILEKPSNES